MSMQPNEAAAAFKKLIDKSQQKFALLRELPPYGRRHWEEHFHKAFEVYSALWKFQQEERQPLTAMGLKRWEIGEIASKIGQLYYNYYLRTSDVTFLSESYIFYEAIQKRGYLQGTGSTPALAVKQLRYYARFVVVCLLLNRREAVTRLNMELDALVAEHALLLPEDTARDWRLVVQEIDAFLAADRLLGVPAGGVEGGVEGVDGAEEELLSFRCRPPAAAPPAPAARGVWPLRLREAIIVSHKHRQVKFSELPLDTYRMLQALEVEPPAGGAGAGAGGGLGAPPSVGGSGGAGGWENPHKYLVYRPTVPRLLLVLATGCDELPRDSALLLYVSADGARPPPTPAQPGGGGGDGSGDRQGGAGGAGGGGGVLLSAASSGAVLSGDARETCLLPHDLLPFTRRPLVLVVDSDNSRAFLSICGQERGEAAVCLCSPQAAPPGMDDPEREGSAFSLFLTAPAPALCKALGARNPSPEAYAALEAAMEEVLGGWADLMAASPHADAAWSRLLGDVFLRQIATRFALCQAVMALHRDFQHMEECQPAASPGLPPEAMPHAAAVQAGLHRLARCVGAEGQLVLAVDCRPAPLPSTPVDEEGGGGGGSGGGGGGGGGSKVKKWADVVGVSNGSPGS